MGCCKDKISQVIQITKGHINLLLDELNLLPPTIRILANKRFEICLKCEKHTWLTGMEYVKWLKNNGIEVLKNLDRLETLPELPDGEKGDGKQLFCKLCKCRILAAAHLVEKICLLGKWQVFLMTN